MGAFLREAGKQLQPGFLFSAKSNCAVNRCVVLGTALNPPGFLVLIFKKRRFDKIISESFSCLFIA